MMRVARWKNYSATNKEALAVIWAMRKFMHYLLGRHTTIATVTDHRALVYLDTVTDTTGQLHRWALEMQAYDHILWCSIPQAKDNANADTLSRTLHAFDRDDSDGDGRRRPSSAGYLYLRLGA